MSDVPWYIWLILFLDVLAWSYMWFSFGVIIGSSDYEADDS